MEAIWITKASYLEGLKLHLTFSNGSEGIVDLAGQLQGSIFEPLQQPAFFANFQLNDWTITWPNGADLAPEFLHALLAVETPSN